MHLKTCPKLMRTELCLDAAGVQTSSQRSSLFVGQQGALPRTCSSNHGIFNSTRLPFSIISTNMLRRTSTTNGIFSSSVASLQTKALSSPSLQLAHPAPGCENDTPTLHQTATEDAESPLDIWAVIKPGHVREKIAIFASEAGWTDGAGGGERISTSTSNSQDRTPAICMNHVAVSCPARATKAKGSWEENCSAKRRRRSGNNQKQNLQRDLRTYSLQSSPCCPTLTRQSDVDQCGGDVVTEEEEHKVSVVEMVAFLEQRVSERRPDCKPLLALQRSSTTITLSRAPLLDVRREGFEVRGEEPENIRVSEIVAKLESECLRRRAEGDLSRSNSLRRSVGRVLLAGDQSSAPSQLASSVTSSLSSSTLPGAQSASREPISCLETTTDTPASALATPSPLHPGELVGESEEARGGEGLTKSTVSQTAAPPPPPQGAEPLPGLLFLCPLAEPFPHTDSCPPPPDSEHHPPRHRTACDLQPTSSQPVPLNVGACPDIGSHSEKRRRRSGPGGQVVGSSPLSRRASASQDFLEMRQRVQQLLAPQPYLAVLPHHLLVKIFLLLPTQSLAALKCTCHYFKFVIENYGVRPADSLWVSDPRYRDDPCKQCKKRYDRGDVSLCRWHHKPYCQALPYGPGYWMCCHGAHRDTPGCNVGLHDNRWVPPFHSINVPIYRRNHNNKNDWE